jgi:hypothetical protein
MVNFIRWLIVRVVNIISCLFLWFFATGMENHRDWDFFNGDGDNAFNVRIMLIGQKWVSARLRFCHLVVCPPLLLRIKEHVKNGNAFGENKVAQMKFFVDDGNFMKCCP